MLIKIIIVIIAVIVSAAIIFVMSLTRSSAIAEYRINDMCERKERNERVK